MHWTIKTAALALALAPVAGCRDAASPPPSSPETRGPAFNQAAGTEVQRLRLDVTAWLDLRTTVPLEVVTPAAAANIGPGSAIIMDIPNEGRFGCTANFVWAAGGRRYLGAAGHCFVPADRAATHGPGADYDASGVVVTVCVENCEGNFRTNQLTGTWVTLGKVAYARQTNQAAEDVGNDFGVVEIPRQVRDLVRLSLPVWGGPSGVETLELGDYGCHYGHGLGVGEVFVTKARVGVGGGSDSESWMGDFAGTFGDSGSPMVGCVNDGVGSFQGTGAIGVLTHLGVGLDETTGAHGVVFGTTIARAIEMATEANLGLRLVMP